MPSWTPRNLQTLQNLPLHFQVDLNKLWNIFPPIGSQAYLEQYFVGLKIWGPTAGSTCLPPQALKFPPISQKLQLQTGSFSWVRVSSCEYCCAKTLSNGVTTMQLKMVVAMLKYEPRDARSFYFLNRIHVSECFGEMTNLFVFFFFIPFIFISWRLITLQYCSGFCHTLTWVSHGFTCIPHPDPPSHLPLHPIPLGHPSAPALSTCLMHPTWAGDLFHHR